MSGAERKRIIDEALHGAKVGVEDQKAAPGLRTTSRPATPCCAHCSLKTPLTVTVQPTVTPANFPYLAPSAPLQSSGLGGSYSSNYGIYTYSTNPANGG